MLSREIVESMHQEKMRIANARIDIPDKIKKREYVFIGLNNLWISNELQGNLLKFNVSFP